MPQPKTSIGFLIDSLQNRPLINPLMKKQKNSMRKKLATVNIQTQNPIELQDQGESGKETKGNIVTKA